ncbi:hypothetical protein DsansV1_C02g0021901 [Dioscorea sansibarensis]
MSQSTIIFPQEAMIKHIRQMITRLPETISSPFLACCSDWTIAIRADLASPSSYTLVRRSRSILINGVAPMPSPISNRMSYFL